MAMEVSSYDAGTASTSPLNDRPACEGYQYLFPAKFKNGPLTQRFLQYHQISSRNFLVSLGVKQQKIVY